MKDVTIDIAFVEVTEDVEGEMVEMLEENVPPLKEIILDTYDEHVFREGARLSRAGECRAQATRKRACPRATERMQVRLRSPVIGGGTRSCDERTCRSVPPHIYT